MKFVSHTRRQEAPGPMRLSWTVTLGGVFLGVVVATLGLGSGLLAEAVVWVVVLFVSGIRFVLMAAARLHENKLDDKFDRIVDLLVGGVLIGGASTILLNLFPAVESGLAVVFAVAAAGIGIAMTTKGFLALMKNQP